MNAHVVYYEAGLKTPPDHVALIRRIGNLMRRPTLVHNAPDTWLPGVPTCNWVVTGAFPTPDARERASAITTDALEKIGIILRVQYMRNKLLIGQVLDVLPHELQDAVDATRAKNMDKEYALWRKGEEEKTRQLKRGATEAAPAAPAARRAPAPQMPTTAERRAALPPLHPGHTEDLAANPARRYDPRIDPFDLSHLSE